MVVMFIPHMFASNTQTQTCVKTAQPCILGTITRIAAKLNRDHHYCKKKKIPHECKILASQQVRNLR